MERSLQNMPPERCLPEVSMKIAINVFLMLRGEYGMKQILITRKEEEIAIA